MLNPNIIHLVWNMSSKMFEHSIRNWFSIEQWFELESVPEDIHKKLKILCCNIFSVKTKTVETLEVILEHSLISSIQAQIMFVNYDFNMNLIISNSVYEVFNRIETSLIFETVIEEYRIAWYAAKKIQFHWKICISNPNYFMCKKRLRREFYSM